MTQPAQVSSPKTSTAKKVLIGFMLITALLIIGVGSTYNTVKNSFEPTLESVSESFNGAATLHEVSSNFGVFDSFAVSLWKLDNGTTITLRHDLTNLPFFARVNTTVLESQSPVEFTSYLSFFGSKTSFDIERFELPLDLGSQEVMLLENITGSLSLNNSQDLKMVLKAQKAQVKSAHKGLVKMNGLFMLAEGSLDSIELFDVAFEVAEITTADNSFNASDLSFFASSTLEDENINLDYFGSLKNGAVINGAGDEVKLDQLSFKSSLAMPQQVYLTLTRDVQNINEENLMQTVALALEKGVRFNLDSVSVQYRLQPDNEAEHFDMSGSLDLSASADEVNQLAENPMIIMNLVKGQFSFDLSPPLFLSTMEALPMMSDSLAKSAESPLNRDNKVVMVELKNSEIYLNNEKVM